MTKFDRAFTAGAIRALYITDWTATVEDQLMHLEITRAEIELTNRDGLLTEDEYEFALKSVSRLEERGHPNES